MLARLFILLLTICHSLAENEPTGSPIRAQVLVQLQNNVHIVDLRGEEARELDGFIEGSIVVPDQITNEIEQRLKSLKNEIVASQTATHL